MLTSRYQILKTTNVHGRFTSTASHFELPLQRWLAHVQARDGDTALVIDCSPVHIFIPPLKGFITLKHIKFPFFGHEMNRLIYMKSNTKELECHNSSGALEKTFDLSSYRLFVMAGL